jgi:transcriptional regulator with XRE-family HTH domain
MILIMNLTFAEQVRLILERRRMTIRELASIVGTTEQYLTPKLKTNNLDMLLMYKIADALNTEMTIQLSELGARITTQRNYDYLEKKKRIRVKELNKKQPIYQYDLDGKFIAEHKTTRAASRAIGKGENSSAIVRCLNGNRKTAYGFVWKRNELQNNT